MWHSSRAGKNDPLRSFGILNPRFPAVAVKVQGFVQLRRALRSAERSKDESPTHAVASAWISSV